MTARRTGRRADARRNRAAIIEAAGMELAADPGTPTARIARSAGVGRVTLYSHFPSRERLLRDVLDNVLAEVEAKLAAIDLAGSVDEERADLVMATVLRSAWQNLDQLRRVRMAVAQELGPQLLRSAHERIFGRVEGIVQRGQHQGVFRADLPAAWLAAMVYALIHGAADQVDAGTMHAEHVPDLLATTALAALGAPDGCRAGEAGTVTGSGPAAP
jgi:TetR/AcrR family transcriptional repressor of mexCD-oprJ operon